MSAAEAKRSVSAKPANEDIPRKPEASECGRVPEPAVACHDSVIDGKAEKASYNPGAEEHIVHVTEIRKNENDTVNRFIIGARPTGTGRNGEWGAAVSISEALTHLPGDRVIVVSGDAGFCVEEFRRWLNGKGFFYIFRIKENAGNIFLRVRDRASYLMEIKPQGNFRESVRSGSDEIHSRELRRIPGLYYPVYPGIREGSAVRKTDLNSLKTELRYFITDRPAGAWDAQSIADRILRDGCFRYQGQYIP